MIGNRRMLRYQDFSSVPRAPARSAPPAQLAQQLVEPVEQAGPFGGEVVAAFGQQPQDHRLVFGGDDAQTAVLVQGDLGDGVRVVGVGLAASAGSQQPDAGGQGCRDVEHVLAGGGELLGDAAAETVRALDGELPLRPARRPREQGTQSASVDREPASPKPAAGGGRGRRR
jgi:hypothetical protein